jgi:peptide/nickel transport system permease protein
MRESHSYFIFSFFSFSKGNFRKIAWFIIKKGLSIFFSVCVATYATILIAEQGGYIDTIVIAQIKDDTRNLVMTDPLYSRLPPDQQQKLIDAIVNNTIKARGLDTPFYIRSFLYLKNALTLDLGRAIFLTSDSGSKRVSAIIAERLPYTIMLFTTATLLGSLITLSMGLYLSRHRGSLIDRLIVTLAPLSTIPGWFYGIIFIMIFAMYLGILPYGGLVSVPPPEDPLMYALDVLRHSILPLFAWLFAGFWLGSYSNRNFFLIFSTHDYVRVGDAKGLGEETVLWRYIVRPSLPNIVTSLSLGIIGSWTGATVTETVFNWPGLGSLTYQAIGVKDTPIIVGTTVIYAYLLGITVLFLDLVYAALDPRIKKQVVGT